MTANNEKLTIYLAYLQNAWAKIAQYKNRQWTVVIIHNALYFLLLTNHDALRFFKSENWLIISIISLAPLLSAVALLFCWHLRHKIQIERSVIKHFEDTYLNETSGIRTIRGDVMNHDLGDKLVYKIIFTFIAVLTLLVVYRHAGFLVGVA